MYIGHAGKGLSVLTGCACMSKPVWKPVRASAWDGLCQDGCM